jgi:hypothetical protein
MQRKKADFMAFSSCMFDGLIHDKKITYEQPLRMPAGIILWQDTGFLGHNP